jgi:hypothetical protein
VDGMPGDADGLRDADEVIADRPTPLVVSVRDNVMSETYHFWPRPR